MSTAELFYRFGTALAIGFLVGLQREFSFKAEGNPASFAGARTFTLLGLAGCMSALVAEQAGAAWFLPAAFGVLGALVVASYVVTSRAGDVGTTTEVAALVTFLVGALCYHGMLALSAAVGVATALVLSAKLSLEKFVARLRREDLVAALKFGVVTAIVFPVLPNQGLGPPPLDVLNPRNIWLMVVLISAIGFVAYVLFHLVGPRRGIGLTGILGGLVSSTALTLSFVQRSRARDRLAKPLAVAIMAAWTMMFVRVIAVVAVVNRALLRALWLPMLAAAVFGASYALWLYFSERSSSDERLEFSNPFEIGPALRFGLLYGGVLLLSRAAQLELGNRGVYVSSLVAGLADVDAITLSLAELSRSGEVAYGVAGRAVVLAAMANTAVKAGIVLATGAPSLKRALWPGITLLLAGGTVAALSGTLFIRGA